MADPNEVQDQYQKHKAIPRKTDVSYYVEGIPASTRFSITHMHPDPVYSQVSVEHRISGVGQLNPEGAREYKVRELSKSKGARLELIDIELTELKEKELPPTAKGYDKSKDDARRARIQKLEDEKTDIIRRGTLGRIIAPSGYRVGAVIPANASKSALLTSAQVASLVEERTNIAIAEKAAERQKVLRGLVKRGIRKGLYPGEILARVREDNALKEYRFEMEDIRPEWSAQKKGKRPEKATVAR